MGNTLRQGAAQLKELAGTGTPLVEPATVKPVKAKKAAESQTVLIGAHFPRAVRRSLAQLQADPRNEADLDPLR